MSGLIQRRNGAGRLRVGVLGCGYWGSKHARVLQGMEAVDLVVIDADPRRVEQLCRTFPGIRGFTDLTSAMDLIDAAVIATPPTSHAPIAMQLIEAGKSVLIEKPMTTTVADARALIDAASRCGVVLMAGHTFEYNSAVWKLREIVRRNELGKPYYFDTARLNLGLYQNDVNVIFDLAPHDISIINHVLGQQPDAVHSWGSRNAHPFHEDVAYLRFYYETANVYANVHVSWLDPHKVRRVTVVGSEKMVVYDDLSTEGQIRVHDKSVIHADNGPDQTQPPMTYRYGDVVAPYLAVNEPLRVEDEHFVDCVLSGERPQTDGEVGLGVVAALEAAQLSLEENRLVELAELDQTRRLEPAGHAVGGAPS